MPKSLTEKAISGGLTSVANKILGIIISIIFMGILSRIISPSDYGAFAKILLLSTLSGIPAAGIGQSIIRNMGSEEQINKNYINFCIILSILSATLCTWLLAISPPSKGEDTYLLLSSCFVISIGISTSTYLDAILSKIHAFTYQSKIELISQSVIGNSVTLIFAAIIKDYKSLIYGLIIALAIKIIFQIIYIKKHDATVFSKQARSLNFYKDAWMFILIQFFNYFGRNGDNWVVSEKLGAFDLGLYSRAFNLMNKPMAAISSFVNSIFYPLMVNAKQEPEKFRRGYTKAMTIASIFGIPLSFYFFISSKSIIFIVLGPKWADVYPIFSILSIGCYFRMTYRITESINFANGNLFNGMISQLFYGLLILIFALWGSTHGLIGTAYGVLISLALFFLISLHQSNKITGDTFYTWLEHITPLTCLCAIASAIAAYINHLLNKNSSTLIEFFILFSIYWPSVFILSAIFIKIRPCGKMQKTIVELARTATRRIQTNG